MNVLSVWNSDMDEGFCYIKFIDEKDIYVVCRVYKCYPV